MIENMEEVKKPKTVLFSNIILQFIIIVFFTVIFTLLLTEYFIFMFISIVIAGITTLFLKSEIEMPIPKKLSQQFGNLIKAMTDIIISNGKNTPAIQELKDIIQKTIVWNIREAKITPEFDRETLEDIEEYILKKVAPESEN